MPSCQCLNKDSYRNCCKLKQAEKTVKELVEFCHQKTEKIANLKDVLKDICNEWNEDCNASCNSYGHDSDCASVNIASAKKKLREENESLRSEVVQLKKELSKK